MSTFAFVALPAGFVLGMLCAVWLLRRNNSVGLSQAEERGRLSASAEAAGVRGELSAAIRHAEHTDQQLAAARQSVSALEVRNATLEAELKSERDRLERERTLLQELDAKLPERFKATASDVLADAQRRMHADFESHSALISQKEQNMMQPIRESLKKLELHTADLESKRASAYGDIHQQIAAMQRTHTDLRTETRQLVSALSSPKVRGNWGEMQLRRCIEFAGMLNHVDFVEQPSTRDHEGALLRPDVLVHLPNKRVVLVDAKAVWEAFYKAMGAPDTSEGYLERIEMLKLHAVQVRQRLQQLDRKSYGREFAPEGSSELVICFLPSETLLYAALEQDPSLIEFSSTVVLATPTTLIALLKAVECGWQNLETARNAQEIREHALKIYDKLATATDKLTSLGNSLKSAVGHYNGFLTTAQGKGGVFSIGRKLKELRISNEELEEIADVAVQPDQLTHDAWLSEAEPEPFALAAAAEQSTEPVSQG